jgi:hypothetical protein
MGKKALIYLTQPYELKQIIKEVFREELFERVLSHNFFKKTSRMKSYSDSPLKNKIRRFKRFF